MSQNAVRLTLASAIGVIVFAAAFFAAPRSCDGGLTFYFWLGVASLVFLSALPFIKPAGNAVGMRLGWSLGFTTVGAAVWIAGLVLANVRIMCRLF
jgi:hypothetical protein